MSINRAGDHAGAPAVPAALFANPAVDRVFASYGIFLLRVAIGVDWIVHAFLKTYRGMYTHEALLANDIPATIRLTRGQDIDAACGQLAAKTA